MKNFIDTINNIYDIKYINKEQSPIKLIDHIMFPEQKKRLNHYCIKLNDSINYNYGELSKETIQILKKCISSIPKEIILDDRYCYITIDNKSIKKGQSQRAKGLHIDGLQGDEVTIKKEGDLSLIWMNTLPTEFISNAQIDPNLNLSKYNLFNHIEVKSKGLIRKAIDINSLYMINSYMPHQSVISDIDQDRLFVRISFSKIPITSIKMSINNDLEYNYEIHKTTGEIPDYLI